MNDSFIRSLEYDLFRVIDLRCMYFHNMSGYTRGKNTRIFTHGCIFTQYDVYHSQDERKCEGGCTCTMVKRSLILYNTFGYTKSNKSEPVRLF